jgi:hypothetical protein
MFDATHLKMFNREVHRVVAQKIDFPPLLAKKTSTASANPTDQLRLKLCTFTLCFFRWSLSSIG